MKKLGGREGKERFRGKKRQARWQGTVGCRLKELYSSKKVDWRQSNRGKKRKEQKGKLHQRCRPRPPNPPPGKGLANPPIPGQTPLILTRLPNLAERISHLYNDGHPQFLLLLCKAYHFHNKHGSSSTPTSLPQGPKLTLMQSRPSRSQTKKFKVL